MDNVNYYHYEAISQRTQVPMACVLTVSRQHKIPTLILYTLLSVEGGKPGLRKENFKGNHDYGPAQINTVNIESLKRRGFSESEILNNPCRNIEAAALLLSESIVKSDNVWVGIGRYHSGTPDQNFKYRMIFFSALKKIKKAMRLNTS